MKIRIKGNSIRLRLTKTEIINFGEQGSIEERTLFAGGVFLSYKLQRQAGINELKASYTENKITVLVPEAMAQEWVATDIVGFENKMDTGNGEQLFLLIEKDWVCLDNTFEDQSDNFPNPNLTC
jgi:hypothetical protein